MSGAKLDVIWSPTNPRRFLTFGPDLRLYEVSEIDGNEIGPKTETAVISDKTIATLLSINTEHQYMKCVSWYPKTDPEHLLAVGQSSGKILLTSFDHNTENQGLVGREFMPRHARQCNCVAWNPFEHHLLASGLDKNRADCAILVWDISNPPVHSEYMPNKKPGSLSFTPHTEHHHSTSTSCGTYKPQVELGLSETCHSLQWFLHQPKTLVSGMNNKNLKVFDLRDCSKHQNACATKAVFGVCVDPYFEHRLASYVDNQVMIWDIRYFEKPVVTLNEVKPVIKLSWSPRRCNLLASLARESFQLKLYDIQQTPLSSDDIEPTVVERMIQPYGQQNLSSFSWHPGHENRLLTINHTSIIRDYTIFDRITLNWAPTSELVWTHGKKLLQYIDNRNSLFENLEDISVKMRIRALMEYGLKSQQLWQNGEMAQDNPSLNRLWTWLDTVKSLQEEGKLRLPSKNDIKYEGLHSILCSATPDGSVSLIPVSKSDEVHAHWQGLERNVALTITIYKSEERDKALLLCGWGGDCNGNALSSLLDRLEMDGQYCRAAAIAVFNLKLIRAISILKKGAQVRSSHGGDANLNMVAMAVSGFSESYNSLWQDLCQQLRLQLQDPYLRAMFTFLTCPKHHYEEVLAETGLTVQDKVAFACHFLPDTKLADFISVLTSRLIELGDLDGILLTGLTLEGLSLLQSYVDHTSDVQTASLVVLQSQSQLLCENQKTKLWVSAYRELLDGWRLWHQRALFDTHWYKANPTFFPQPQSFVSCNYCGKSITSHLQMMGQTQGPRQVMRFQIAASNKVMSCPGCRKPLPRCALCMMNMGTQAGAFWKSGADERDQNVRLTKFSNWFTWCQTCRHGGHSSHIIKWFDEHPECPVTGCNCKCMSLDSVSKVKNS